MTEATSFAYQIDLSSFKLMYKAISLRRLPNFSQEPSVGRSCFSLASDRIACQGAMLPTDSCQLYRLGFGSDMNKMFLFYQYQITN